MLDDADEASGKRSAVCYALDTVEDGLLGVAWAQEGGLQRVREEAGTRGGLGGCEGLGD